MKALDTKAIRARAEAATKGEWRARRHGRNFSITSGLPPSMLVVADVFNDTPDMGGTVGEPDATFIAAARTDVPALCARVEALEAALATALGYARIYVDMEPTTLGTGDEVERLHRVLEGR